MQAGERTARTAFACCCVLVVLFSFGCGAFADDDGSIAAKELEVAHLINEERTTAGLVEVELRDDLSCAARLHSEDIGARRDCTHTGADGSQPGDRVAACGGTTWSGEIVACGDFTARAAVDSWLSSPGHREIMLAEHQRWFGVGVHANYWTVVFDRGR